MAAANHQLILGLRAMQNGLIDQVQLFAAFQAWTQDKWRDLADHLLARGDLDAAGRGAIEALVALDVKKQGGTEHSLAAISAGRSTRESLGRIGDSDIDATLTQVATSLSGQNHGDDHTTSYTVGTATSDGQRFRLLRAHARGK